MVAVIRGPGQPGLVDRSHRPRRCSNQMDQAVEVWLIEARKRNPDWEPRRLVHEPGYDRASASPGASGMTVPSSDAVGSPTSAPTLSIAAPRISCARSRSSVIPR